MQGSATKIYKVPQLSDKSFNQKLQFLNLIYITEHKLHLRRASFEEINFNQNHSAHLNSTLGDHKKLLGI